MVSMCVCSRDSMHACYGYSKYRVTEQSLDLNTVKNFAGYPGDGNILPQTLSY